MSRTIFCQHKFVSLLAGLLILLAALALLLPSPLRDFRLFYGFPVSPLSGGLHGRMERCLERLYVNRPAEVTPEAWEDVYGWTHNACHNVCFSPSHVSVEEMACFVEAFEEKLHDQPVTVETLNWVWDELQRIEPSVRHNNEYVKMYKPRFLEALERNGRDQRPLRMLAADGIEGDLPISIVYHRDTGEIAMDVPPDVQLRFVNIESSSGIFTGEDAQNLGGDFDVEDDASLFKIVFEKGFGSTSFGCVARPDLSRRFLKNDLSVCGGLADGGDFGAVELVCVESSP